jgi:protein AFG1
VRAPCFVRAGPDADLLSCSRHPDDLYKNGIQRESFVPTIALLKAQLDVVNLDSGTGARRPPPPAYTLTDLCGADYRRLPRALAHVYRAPLDAATRAETRKLFAAAAGPDIEEGRELRAWGRAVRVPQSGGGAAWFEFDDLCGARHPLSAADYLEITRAFPTVFVTEVPKMNLSNKDMVGAARRDAGTAG